VSAGELSNDTAASEPLRAPEVIAGPPRRKLLAYIQLLRLPAVFTALADIFLGFLLTHEQIGSAPSVLRLLLGTSACLYLAGMVFNDVFDRRIDAIERPRRPIPSGRVPLRVATALGAGLIVAGLGFAAAVQSVSPAVAGWSPLIVAAVLLGAIFLYDGVLKSTPIGPVAMGLCRFLNIILGASAASPSVADAFDNPQRWIAAGMAIYVAGVTWFSRAEATQSRRGALFGALLVINAGIATLMGWVQYGGLERDSMLPLLLLVIIALTVNRRMLVAVSNPSPAIVQATVRTLLLTIITLDAALIFARTGNIVLATVIAAGLIAPALLIGRAIRIT
jgi:4-hydroxybenzoate polyprenyltransferase